MSSGLGFYRCLMNSKNSVYKKGGWSEFERGVAKIKKRITIMNEMRFA